MNQNNSKFMLSINTGEGEPPEKWEADGDDGTNPLICYFYRFTAGDKIVFDCESYQGVRYGFLTVPKTVPPRMKANFLYIDENDGRISGRYDGDCSLVIE